MVDPVGYDYACRGGGKVSAMRKKVANTQEIIDYMNDHLGEKLSLEDVAKQFQVSMGILNVIFQKHTQNPPMRFFINMKMAKACQLLQTTNLRVYEVADEVGYDNQYYFSKLFKKWFGVSPLEYKQQYRR